MKGFLKVELSKQYHRTKLVLSLVSTGLGWAYLLLLVLTPRPPAPSFIRSGNRLCRVHYLHAVVGSSILNQPNLRLTPGATAKLLGLYWRCDLKTDNCVPTKQNQIIYK